MEVSITSDEKSFDRNLLRKISEGNHDAFRLFYDTHYPRANRFVSYFIKNHDIRDELVSDVFFNIWQNREKLPGIANFNAYFYTSIRNRALDHIRKSKGSVTEEPLEIGFVTNVNTPEELLLNEELHRKVAEAIEELPERCKLIFLMAKSEGLKYREVAEILNISEKTVNAQMVIALRKLGDALLNYLRMVVLFPV